MRLLNNLYVLTGPCFGLLSHVFAVKYSKGLVFIDAGMKDESKEQIEHWLTYWGLENEKVTHVLITHGHWDHVGLAAHYREKGACIAAHRADRVCIENGSPPPGAPAKNFWPPCGVDMILEGDTKIPIGELEFEAIHTPGHTPGTMVYRINLEGKDVWFTGDFFPPDARPAHGQVTGWKGDLSFSAKNHLESCKKLAQYRPDCVLAGHGYLRTDGCKDIFEINFQNNLLAFSER